jgi:hypothetical protein
VRLTNHFGYDYDYDYVACLVQRVFRIHDYKGMSSNSACLGCSINCYEVCTETHGDHGEPHAAQSKYVLSATCVAPALIIGVAVLLLASMACEKAFQFLGMIPVLCLLVFYVLRPSSPTRPLRIWADGKTLNGGGPRSKLDGQLVSKYVYDSHGLDDFESSVFSFHSQCPVQNAGTALLGEANFIAAKLPLEDLIPHLTRPQLTSVSKIHGVAMYAQLKVADAREVMSQHTCDRCPEIVSILSLIKPVRKVPADRKAKENVKAYHKIRAKKAAPSAARTQKKQRNLARDVKKLKYFRKGHEKTLEDTSFPPHPASDVLVHRILTASSTAVQPIQFVEDGCTVCGCLTPLYNLTPLSEYEGNLDCLHAQGVTRKERFLSSDPIEDLLRPVLADGCSHICVDCEIALTKKSVPRHALVNHNWIGQVPPQLQDLRYTEKMMIARVRHNRCVIRVKSGRVRMHANAIMFAQPVLKVYLKLPPSREEMAEVLAFIFTGTSAPTQEDFERTPMLVKRDKVLAALEWLKLNHEGYSDLEISEFIVLCSPGHTCSR